MVKSRPLEYRRFSWCRWHCTTIVSLSHYHTSGCIVSEQRSGCHDVFDFLQADFLLSGLDWIKIVSSYEDRYLVQNSDIHTRNCSLPPHLSPLRSFLTKVKTDSSDLSFSNLPNTVISSPFPFPGTTGDIQYTQLTQCYIFLDWHHMQQCT